MGHDHETKWGRISGGPLIQAIAMTPELIASRVDWPDWLLAEGSSVHNHGVNLILHTRGGGQAVVEAGGYLFLPINRRLQYLSGNDFLATYEHAH